MKQKTLIGPVAIIWLSTLILAMKLHGADTRTLFDFSQTNQPGDTWQVVNDDVMGGVSTSRFEFTTNGTAVFTGVLSLENNGGFASVRSLPARQDLTGFNCLVIRILGDGRLYKLTIRTGTGSDSPLYQCSFPTRNGGWTEQRMEFKDFTPTYRGRVLASVPPIDPGQIRSVGFLIADKQAGPFRLEMASLKAGQVQAR